MPAWLPRPADAFLNQLQAAAPGDADATELETPRPVADPGRTKRHQPPRGRWPWRRSRRPTVPITKSSAKSAGWMGVVYLRNRRMDRREGLKV
jgi:hypothetical protein